MVNLLFFVSSLMSVVTCYGTGYSPISGYLPAVGHQQQYQPSYHHHPSSQHHSPVTSYHPSPYQSPLSQYGSPPCSDYYEDKYPQCNSSPSQTNCTVVIDNMYTIEYMLECGRKYNKVCYGPDNSDCKAVVDPGCYQVPTHSPVQVPREICFNPSTGEKCDNYSKKLAES